MTLDELFLYVKEKYHLEHESLSPKQPNYYAIRNPETRKRFVCGIIGAQRKWVNAGEEGIIDIAMVKGDPNMIQYLCTQPGFRPGYHLNKKHRITFLMGPMSPKDEEIKTLIDISYKYSCKDWKRLLGLK